MGITNFRYIFLLFLKGYYAVKTLRERVIRATFIVWNENL